MRRGKSDQFMQLITLWCVLTAAAATAAESAGREPEQGSCPVMRRVQFVNGHKIVVDERRLDHLKPDETFSPFPGVRVTLLSEAEAKRRLGKGARRPPLEAGWVSELYEDFESGDWDSKWVKRTENGGYTWGRVRYNPYEGTYCCWCADRESAGYPEKNAETDNHDNYMDAWLEYPNFDTRGCDSGTLSFALWHQTEDTYDYLGVYFSQYWEGYEWIGDFNGWHVYEYDLDDWGPNQRNLMGFADLRMVFRFVSDAIVTRKGSFLDNIDLRKRLTTGGPDLVVDDLDASPLTLDQGDLLTIDAAVMNQGENRSGETNVKFYLTQDGAIDASDYLIKTASVFALDPNEKQNYHEMINIPTSVPDGGYYLGAIVDEADNVYEEDETNNLYVPGNLYMNIGDTGAPDLVVGNVVLTPSAGPAGSSTEVSFELRNIGTAAAGAPHNARIFWSTDNSPDPGDDEMTTVAVYDVIPAGGVQNISRNVNILQGMPAGNYYVIVFADADGNVNESDENNNTGSASYMVQGTGVGTASGAVPSEYFLSDNYPNPFNPSTTISFGLPEKASVCLSVYDISGRLVRTLARTDLNAGEYRILWDSRDDAGSAVPSGVYFYHLRAGGFSRSGKMVLMD